MIEFNHLPVMPDEVLEGLNIKPNGVYFDGTLGGGGHSSLILDRLTSGRLIAVDKDPDALMFAGERLKSHAKKISFIHDDFKNVKSILERTGVTPDGAKGGLDGVLLDLGVSSYQLDNAERGFSYMKTAPLDMRMNTSQYLTAFNVINEYSASELIRIFRDYGEEKLAGRIANNIVAAREKKTIATTTELAEIVEKSYPAATRWKFGHPAKRVFQAVRIEINDELTGLYEAIKELTLSLNPEGRIAVIGFHSLEDRLTKMCFKELESDCVCPPNMPICTCGHKREIKVLTKKPIQASEAELKVNKRAESAKLRIAERL